MSDAEGGAGGPMLDVRRRLRICAGLTVGAVGVLAVATSLPLLEVLALPIFLVLFPGLAWSQLPLLDEGPLDRIPVYLGSGGTILTLGVLAVALSTQLEGGSAAIGLVSLEPSAMVPWTLGITAAGLGLILLSLPVSRWLGESRPGFLRELMPRTRKEKGLFALLSGAAGAGEETAYRGYAFTAVQLLGLGPLGAALVTSVSFGALHAYQGPVGFVRTGLVGLLFVIPVVVTGSLLPSIAAHALIDLVLGLLLAKRLIAWSEETSRRDRHPQL